MFTRFDGLVRVAQGRRFFSLQATCVASLLSVFTLVGCGGGGGSAAPSPLPTATPGADNSAKARSVSANFLPNYVPDAVTPSKRYLRWANNKNIRVFIRPSVDTISSNAPNTSISDATVRSVVDQSIDNWTTATGGDFTFTYVDSAADADIEVVFVNSLLSRSYSPATGLGITSYDFVYIKAGDNSRAFMKKAVIQVIAKQEMPGLVDTMSHEIGHALGVEQHSTDTNDLLYPISQPPAIITQRDQNTMFFLYYSPEATGVGRSTTTVPQNAEVHSGEIVCDR